jgi:hypothetical protein
MVCSLPFAQRLTLRFKLFIPGQAHLYASRLRGGTGGRPAPEATAASRARLIRQVIGINLSEGPQAQRALHDGDFAVSGVIQAPGLFAQAPGLFAQAPGLFAQAPGLFAQAPGLFAAFPAIDCHGTVHGVVFAEVRAIDATNSEPTNRTRF